MPPVSQQQAERALLSKLSTLTPGQLSTLLSAPPGTLPSAPSPQPGGVPPPQSRLRRWTLRLAIALLSLYVGYSAGDELCHVDPWISTLARMKLSHDDQDAEDNLAHAGALPMVARTQNAMFYQAGYPLSHQLLDQSDREALYAMAEETGVTRKVWVVARMETATTGALICEATGLFVVPKGVDLKPADWLW
ncbi:hypothetical protein VdG2_07400 [Verticillium dahliae VDG2]|nr:hypothetical protein VdG2_07400 [Verticillium dahliae VDG2]